jgi:hypothetical protein
MISITKEDLIKQFGGSSFEDVVARVWRRASSKGGEETSQQDYEILSDIVDYIFKSDIDDLKKIDLFFELYEEIPSYTLISECSISYWPLSPHATSKYWERYRNLLNSDNDDLCWALEYHLWSGHFEGTEVEDAWNALTKDLSRKKAIYRILRVSGPVPFELKNNLYDSLIQYREYHPSIYKGIVGSAFDVYGDGTQDQLIPVLDKLDLEPDEKQDWDWVLTRLHHLDEFRAVQRQGDLDQLVKWLDTHEKAFRQS